MSYKIAISGAPSSGKTTLANMASAAMTNSILVEEHAWNVKKLFPAIDWKNQAVRDYMLLSQVIREHSLQHNDDSILLCDSSIVDSIAHNLAFGTSPRFELLTALSYNAYDMVFICDHTEVPLVDNGVRDNNPKLRERLQMLIIEVANRLEYPNMIIHGSPTERLDVVRDWLKQNGAW